MSQSVPQSPRPAACPGVGQPPERGPAVEPREPFLSVVVPVYRNAPTLGELHRRVVGVLDGLGIRGEVVYVVDESPDESLAVLRRIVEADSRARVVVLSRRCGQQVAVLVGLAHCSGRWAVPLDADLQDPPEAIGTLLAEAGGEAAAIFAGRAGEYQSPGRMLTSRLFKRLLGLLTGLPRDAGIYVLLRRDLVDALLRMPVREPNLVAMIGCLGFTVRSIPVERQPRPVGATAYSGWGRLCAGLGALRCVLEHRLGCRHRPYLDTRLGSLVAERIRMDPGAAGANPR